MAQPCRRLAYFDTNIFDNLLKKTGGVIESDEVRLRAAIEADRLSVLLSILNIQAAGSSIAAAPADPEFDGLGSLR
jgi:hypothetical protein